MMHLLWKAKSAVTAQDLRYLDEQYDSDLNQIHVFRARVLFPLSIT